jgi:RNA polymerase sigma factor (sigma-70 family)
MRATKPTKQLPPERAYLVTENTGLAHKAANDWVRKRGRIDLLEEATSAAMLALVRAAIGFNPELGWKFSTYAMTACKRTLWRLTEDLERGNLPDDLRIHDAGEIAERPTLPFGPSDTELSDLRECLAVLTPRELGIMVMRFYGGDNLEECGKRIGVSKERIRQIQQGAILKMQHFAGVAKIPKSRKALAKFRDAVEPGLFVEDAA